MAFNRAPLEYCCVTVEADKPFYKPLEKVRLSLAVKDLSGNPVSQVFHCLCVMPAIEIHTGYHENIPDRLVALLKYESYIAHPMQYFGTDDRSNRIEVGLVDDGTGVAPLQLAGDGGVSPFMWHIMLKRVYQ